jgi:hypothetical protein
MRILADIPDDDVEWLDRKSRETGRSRAALLREAVACYRAGAAADDLDRYFGLWARHGFAEDGLDYQRRMRLEWDRDAGRNSD